MTRSVAEGPVTRVLSKLEGVRRSGSGWIARCPAHDDRHPSLHITADDDRRALLHCHAGCSIDAVTNAIGITSADLFEESQATRIPADRGRHPRADGRSELFVVRAITGEPLAVHERRPSLNGKRFKWRQPDGTPGLNGASTTELPLYGSEHVSGWDQRQPVLVTEGEKAAQALLDAGFRAVGTVTGASACPTATVMESLRGYDVILWPDADDVGCRHMRTLAATLQGIAATLRIINWAHAPEHGDAADLLDDGEASDVEVLISSATPMAASGPVLVRLDTVEREALAPIWEGRLYRGKLHLVDGDPGLGKSTAMLDIAARISTGSLMPDSSPGITASGVVILGAEDGLADIIRPRLEAAGANLSRVVALTAIQDASGDMRMPALPGDVANVEEAVRKVQAALLIVDPFMAFLDSTVNSWRDQDVRRALAPLAGLAERTGCAMVLIRHLNKSAGTSALYRGGGSIGIIGAARLALLVATDPDDEGRRILAMVKNNLAPARPSLAFRLVGVETLGAARVEWLGESELGASDLVATPSDDDRRSAVDDACQLLREILADGPLPQNDVEAHARAAGLSRSTLKRAKKKAGVESERVGGLGASGGWMWNLPAKESTEPLRGSSPDGEPLSAAVSPLVELHHQCHRCRAFADDSELMRYDDLFVHRQACPGVSA